MSDADQNIVTFWIVAFAVWFVVIVAFFFWLVHRVLKRKSAGTDTATQQDSKKSRL
jgi:flagellar biosynthesis/type III secretory pathway M-ring protein FliF/YscJ